jgi:serine/threonine protein kinase
MNLTLGTKLGPYEIVSLVGAGGMGEAYRARDSRLKREVRGRQTGDRSTPVPVEAAREQRKFIG